MDQRNYATAPPLGRGADPTGDITAGLSVLAERVTGMSERVRQMEMRIHAIMTPEAPVPAERTTAGGGQPAAPSSSVAFEVRRLSQEVDVISAHLDSIMRRVDL